VFNVSLFPFLVGLWTWEAAARVTGEDRNETLLFCWRVH